jgi:predicted transcriptional regulator
VQPESSWESARAQSDLIRLYCHPTILRLLVALGEGRQSAGKLSLIPGCGGCGAEEALRQLRYRWIVDQDENGYTLTNNGALLALRLRNLCGTLHRTRCGRGAHGLQSMPALFEEVQDDLIGITRPDSIHALRDPGSGRDETRAWLAERGFFAVTDGAASLSAEGAEMLESIERCIRTFEVIERFNSFFQIHSLDGMPESALATIDDLICADLICDVPVNFEQGLAYFYDVIRKADRLHGVSTWFLPQIAETIWERVTAGAEIELVITPELAGALWEEEIVKKGRDPAAFPTFRLYVSTVPVTVGLTVTDSALSFGLCNPDGTYDTVHDLVGRTEGAVRWGERLFRHYKEQAVPIEDFFQNRENTTGSAGIQQ